MIILIVEAAVLTVLTILAINYGSLGMLWLLWLFVALDSVLMAFQIFQKFKKKSKSRLNRSSDNGLSDSLIYSNSKSRLSPAPTFLIPDDKPIPHVDETFSMDGRQFEYYIAELYRRLGYKLISSKKSCDQGIDIIVKRIFKTGIQAKCYSRPVGNKAVQEAAAGKHFYCLHKVLVVTNGIFTDSAKALAQKNKVTLIDRKQLAAMVKKANAKRH